MVARVSTFLLCYRLLSFGAKFLCPSCQDSSSLFVAWCMYKIIHLLVPSMGYTLTLPVNTLFWEGTSVHVHHLFPITIPILGFFFFFFWITAWFGSKFMLVKSVRMWANPHSHACTRTETESYKSTGLTILETKPLRLILHGPTII